MNKDNLIKKLENLDLPKIELPSHHRRLKMALLNSRYFKKNTIMSLFQKVVPVGSVIAITAIIAVIGFSFKGTTPYSHRNINDWQYFPKEKTNSSGQPQKLYSVQGRYFTNPGVLSNHIGFATGGAKDIGNFRENIKNDYLPLLTDITYEGLFYDYYFDTGEKKKCDKLFCPSYSYAISKDPFSNNKEYYLSVGLNSGIKESDFQRKKLNLVIVLDISGSMESSFEEYYYDRFNNYVKVENGSNKSKLEVAKEAVLGLLDHLNADDRFGMVLFNDEAYLAKPLGLVGEMNMAKIKDHILGIEDDGGTYMSSGMEMGTKLFDEFSTREFDAAEYENRIIFLTDAMPNIGETSEEGLLELVQKNAEKKIYSTFIGIGVDFNTELIEAITKIRGANYYSVHSGEQFKQRMSDEFEYMVTPLVFDLIFSLDARSYEIEKVFGSPEANEATGEIMKVNTLFPSKKEGEEIRGGLILLKLRKISPEANLKLKVSYKDRAGKVENIEVLVEIEGKEEFFENSGIRKGILLSRYVSLIKNWIGDERKSHTTQKPIMPLVDRETGIVIPVEIELGEWERQSIPLQVSDHYKSLFSEFNKYFKNEANAIGDQTLEKEIEILDKLSK